MAEPLSLYVHIPFCTAKCGYCDFNSYAGHEHMVPAYAQVLVHEALLWRGPAAGRPVATVFFGGGTPSLVPLDGLEIIMRGLGEAFAVAPDAEVTLEANPGSLDEAYLRGLLALGFNRLSVGVQSFHDDELRALDRLHTADDARAAFRAARAAGFANVNLDLIFGLPEQPMERWQQSVEGALTLEPEHLSLYALTVEEGTPLARDVARGRTPAPDPDAQADQYEWTQGRLAQAGYDQYEISNWARPGYRCRHNLTYWECREYLGLGAGAHSYFGGVRFAGAAAPGQFMSLVEESWREAEKDGGRTTMRHVVSGETITPELAMADVLILGLRLVEGVSLAGFRARFGVDATSAFGDRLADPTRDGLVEIADGSLRLTERGRLLGNDVFAALLPA
ncbi:MAG: radical SAM family heme chaperone HemW [Dehalococcoidia bacterium]|nr:radical SAM family heme chaperone HemW [Dehalococcoidia bacterium]